MLFFAFLLIYIAIGGAFTSFFYQRMAKNGMHEGYSQNVLRSGFVLGILLWPFILVKGFLDGLKNSSK